MCSKVMATMPVIVIFMNKKYFPAHRGLLLNTNTSLGGIFCYRIAAMTTHCVVTAEDLRQH